MVGYGDLGRLRAWLIAIFILFVCFQTVSLLEIRSLIWLLTSIPFFCTYSVGLGQDFSIIWTELRLGVRLINNIQTNFTIDVFLFHIVFLIHFGSIFTLWALNLKSLLHKTPWNNRFYGIFLFIFPFLNLFHLHL